VEDEEGAKRVITLSFTNGLTQEHVESAAAN
jgi:hypothetical protein